jgi:hypothetical protein
MEDHRLATAVGVHRRDRGVPLEGDLDAVRRPGRAAISIAARKLYLVAAIRVHHPDVIGPHERDPPAVWRPARAHVLSARTVGQVRLARPVRAHRVDLPVSVAVRLECDLPVLAREGGLGGHGKRRKAESSGTHSEQAQVACCRPSPVHSSLRFYTLEGLESPAPSPSVPPGRASPGSPRPPSASVEANAAPS